MNNGRISIPSRARPRFGVIAGLRVLVPLLVLSGCATAPPAAEGSRGFFLGVVDGAVAPFAFILSWFSDSIGIYAVPNSGGWYDFGYLIGLTFWAGGCHAATRRKN